MHSPEQLSLAHSLNLEHVAVLILMFPAPQHLTRNLAQHPRLDEIQNVLDVYKIEQDQDSMSNPQAFTRAAIYTSPFALINQIGNLAQVHSSPEDLFSVLDRLELDMTELDTYNPPAQTLDGVVYTRFGTQTTALQLMKKAWSNEVAFKQSQSTINRRSSS